MDAQQPVDVVALRCAVLRGGTSRGVFFDAADLTEDRATNEQILLYVFGSPDRRQINGLGGATSVTSKSAIIGPPSRPDADIDYTFAQVSVTEPVVDWGGNCGNISSAVGPYCINHGVVPITGNPTSIRIHNTNTNKIIVAHVPIAGDRAAVVGDCDIPGVPGTGARIILDFVEPAGSVTGALLPTGSPTDTVTVADGRTFTVSVVDAGNPLVFLLAAELGLTGAELPDELNRRPDVTDTLEEVRGLIAHRLGIVDDPSKATALSPGLPKVGFVSPPQTYPSSSGALVNADEVDLVGRLMTMQTPHQSYMAAGAICTAAAAFIPGTVVHKVTRAIEPLSTDPNRREVRIGHPYGVMRSQVVHDPTTEDVTPVSVSIDRTAREIMEGTTYIPTEFGPAGP